MAPISQLGSLSDWFSRLQCAYMASGDEAVLEEVADLGRLMAVTEVGVETVIEVHGEVLAAELAAAPHADAGRLVAAACTVLSELMLACRIASQRVAIDDDPAIDNSPAPVSNDPSSEFVRFHRDGALGDEHWVMERWATGAMEHWATGAYLAAIRTVNSTAGWSFGSAAKSASRLGRRWPRAVSRCSSPRCRPVRHRSA
jgi:hypothetical protein